ncbi:protein indc11 [Astrocystis sublimbata]|nr:protein indc11 [Astrocystis sublimbata]
MTSIRKVVITEFGDVDVLKILDDTCPPPPPTCVQIATEFSGFTGGDVNMRQGTYPEQKQPPFTPGYCLVGTVRSVGSKCTSVKAGDVVAVLTKYDAEAELVNQPEKYCIKVPIGVPHMQAAAVMCDWNTAYDMVINTAKVSRGQRVFVHGISGAVGCAIMILSRLQGAEVYGTASSRNHEEVQKYGATPFPYTDKNWMEEMKRIGGAHAVFDALGFESFDESYSILTADGILVAFGNNKNALENTSIRSEGKHVAALFARNRPDGTGKRTTFYGLDRDSPSYVENSLALMRMIEQGTIKIPIRQVWDMEDIHSAHRSWGSGSGIGSLLIRVAKT